MMGEQRNGSVGRGRAAHPCSPAQKRAGRAAGGREPIDGIEIYEHIRDIKDPEHPYSLEQLNVVSEDAIEADDAAGYVK